MYENTETTTFACVTGDNRVEYVVREWLARLNDSSTGERWMNQSTVKTLHDAIVTDDRFIAMALATMVNPDMDTISAIRIYRECSQKNMHELASALLNNRGKLDDQRLVGIGSDIHALSEIGDKMQNGRIFALRAFHAWLADDLQAMREYVNTAIYLTNPTSEPSRQTPRTSDAWVSIAAGILEMDRREKNDDVYIAKYKSSLNDLMDKYDELTQRLLREHAPGNYMAAKVPALA